MSDPSGVLPAAAAPSILSVGGIMAAVPFGIPVATIALGMLFAIVGVAGRSAFDVQKAIERGGKVHLGQVFGWLGAGLVGAPFITIVTLLGLRAINVQNDTVTVIGLLFLGFTGPRGLTLVLNYFVDLYAKKFGLGRNP